MSAKRTVMGLAPPANPAAGTGAGGAAPAPNRAPGVPAAGRSPIAPAVSPPAASPIGSPSAPKKPAAAPAPPASASASTSGPAAAAADVPKLYGDDDEPPDDAPTMASDPGQFAEMQAAAAASYPMPKPVPTPAPMKVTPAGPSDALRSPLSSTGYVSPNEEPPQPQREENDAATVTVPKDVLDRVRANPKAVLEEAKAPTPAAGRPYSDIDDSAEPTKAVPREQLLGTKDGHVVIGSDAVGEDATLAVPPGANEASGMMNLGAAIGDSLKGAGAMGPEGAFPPPPGAQPHPYQSIQGMGPMSNPHGHGGMGPQGMGPGMGGMPPGGPGMTMGMPGGMGPGMGPGGPMQAGPWSSGHMPAAIPRQQGGVPSYGGGPMMPGQGGQGGAIPRGQAPTNWNPLQPPAKSRISGQMILLFVVGFVCLAIFVTGIVLFATTKF